MYIYEKKLEFPVKIKQTNPGLSKLIITQFGGPDGELGASLRYFSQRFGMVTPQAKAILNDIATEELAHLEMIGSMCLQLSENADIEQIKKSGFDTYYVDHGTGIYPSSAAGVPFTASYLQSKGDPITDLYEDMAAEQKARSTYEYLMQMTDDPDVLEPLRFLREREIVHFQRFGEALRIVKDYLNAQNQFIISKPDCMKNDKKCPINKETKPTCGKCEDKNKKPACNWCSDKEQKSDCGKCKDKMQMPDCGKCKDM